MPHASLTPDRAHLDSGIADLVGVINTIGVATYASCEGHSNPTFVQSSRPYVSLASVETTRGSQALVRFLTYVGSYNGQTQAPNHAIWVVVPRSDGTLTLRPRDQFEDLGALQRSAVALADHLAASHAHAATSA